MHDPSSTVPSSIAATTPITSSPLSGVPPMNGRRPAVVWSDSKKSPMRWSEDGAIYETINSWSDWRREYRNRLIYIGDSRTTKLINFLIAMYITMRKKESDRTKAFTQELGQILDRIHFTWSQHTTTSFFDWFDWMNECILNERKSICSIL